jgi:hypothetical protein
MNFKAGKTQLELDIERSQEADRNAHLGGRSFYFFDFDDNVAFLATPLILFHKQTGQELAISSGQYAQEHQRIGENGIFENYEINWDDKIGTFRNFRDHHNDDLKRLGKQQQVFLDDVAHALGMPDFHWKGPSWSCFYHATFNQRPVSVITARGHDPQTIIHGIDLFVQTKHLTQRPNFLSIYPVSHRDTRIRLGDADFKLSTAELKQRAIRASVELAVEKYGYSPHHRFGMSDDDPKNIQLIAEEMTRLKSKYPEFSFFMIETHSGDFIKHEVTVNGMQDQRLSEKEAHQYSLFSET